MKRARSLGHANVPTVQDTDAEKRVQLKRNRDDRALRKRFYTHLFPRVSDVIVDLATCGGQFKLHQCEITMWFNIDGHDVQKRDVVFYNAKQLCDRLAHSSPTAINLGGVFLGVLDDPKRVQERHLCTKGGAAAYGPFRVDVDIGDYAPPSCAYDVRAGICTCAPKRVCNKCWHVVLEPGRQVLDYLLKTVMGFKCVFYVFSGRRGYHAWVLDQRVIRWTAYQRAAIIRRLQTLMWDNEGVADEAYSILEPYFDTHLLCNKRQPFFKEWSALEGVVHWRKLAQLKRTAVFDTLYPKFDAPISEDVTHLIKPPLTLHPSTGNFTLTLPPPGKRANAFNPERDSLKANELSEDILQVFAAPIRAAIKEAWGKNGDEGVKKE